MCKVCNLFSPSRTELLTHVSEQHTVESLSPDDIIVPLRPLSTTAQSENSGEECVVVKRKRGRPKGSTKKYFVKEELVDANASPREEAEPGKEKEEKGPESGDLGGVLECRKCSRRFCNTRQLKKHICIMGLKEEGEEEEDELEAPKRLSSFGILLQVPEDTVAIDKLAQTQLKIFTCEYCNKVFKFKHSLQAHLRIHTNEKPFKCPHCDYASTIKANLSVHLRKHTGEKFSCQHCSFSCLSKGHLKVHVERVHKKIKQHCRFCNKKYSDVKNLLKHVRESHDMEDRKVKDCYEEISLQTREGKRQLLYDCHTCDRKFKNQLDRDRHMMVHGDERPYGCELCDHGATKYQALEVHIRKHPFIYLCTVCQHKFVSSVRLRSHIKEAHAHLEETAVFSDSINQSFCLLEPGGDIQPDALKERELQMTEELSLLNAQHALGAELGNTEEVTTEQFAHGVAGDNLEGDFPTKDATLTDMVENQQHQVHSAEDSQSHETTVLDKGYDKMEFSEDSQIHKTTALDKGDDKVECSEDSQRHETTVLDKGDDKVECSEGFQQETVDKQPLQAGDQQLVEICTTFEHTTDVIQQETLNQSAVPSQENLTDTHQPSVATQLDKTLSNKEAESGADNSETTEVLGVTIQSNLPSSGKNTLTADAQEESTAFKKIMDSLQKRQLNMDLFERIRKVYGDLECEYCDSQSHETTVLDKGYDKMEFSEDSQIHKTTALDKGDDKVECSEDSQRHETTVLDKGDDKVECSEGFQQETVDKQPLQAGDQQLVEICTTFEHTTDVIQQETLNQSAVPSQENLTDTHQPSVATQLDKTLSNKEAESGADNSETTEVLGVTIQSNLPSSGKNTLTADAQEESTAFKKIMDSLQKRQLNMDLFERIRKVYGDLECEYCGKLFWYQVHYDMHTRTHTHEHLYYCSQCSYSSITKNCLKRHVIQKHSNILLKCPTEGCEYTTPDKYKLQAHLKIHTELDKRSYVCPVCEKSFPEDRLIKSHIKNSHPEVSMNTISEILGRKVQLKGLIGKRASKCPYCDCYLMRNGSDLQRHIWAHEGVKPFKCSLCDYATRSKSNLKAHMNRHSTEKPHLCDMCGKKFKSRSSLKSHKLQHAADDAVLSGGREPVVLEAVQICRQFKCTVCDFTAVQKPQLLRHMEQHASFKPFRCAHCHYSCNMSGSLKRHYNKKHPNEEYVNAGVGPPAVDMLIQQGGVKCPVCNFVYGTKWEMNRHLKNKHGLKLVEIEGDAKWEHVVESSVEESSTQYLHITETEDLQGTEAAVAALQDLRYNTENGDRLDPTAVNILQQIIELGTESHGAAVASVVAMAPGTVTVVEREQQGNHAVMIQEALQQASVGLGEEHHLVVSSDDMEGIETVTVYTQGEDASEFIVYVQEAVQAEEEQTVEPV
ncbi:Zinc finger protein ZFAT [Acipenser ruthenus]|uniref:Zinc finger protein ZFAT n=1 Tax=Acipenser ruthenus TaxID=7906 RepID=A0A662YZN1_ACIRT|nr:Zinc finger protein ZFAT [Acipenser ruthenus]